MATKKTTNKKTTKATAKKPAAKTKTTPKVKAQPKKTPLPTPHSLFPNVKRPPNTPPITQQVITEVTLLLEQAKAKLETYAAHLRALDRRRLNNIGVKREGFAQRAFRLAMDNPEFLPHYLTRERYIDDYDEYVVMQTAIDVDNQVHELMRNLSTENHDVFYTDGLDYYASVRESAKRRVDASEAIFDDLSPFFKSHGRRNKDGEAEPTKKQLKRDVNALERGTRDGRIVIENIKPKLTGGVHKVIDEQFKDTETFKESEEGSVRE